MAAGYLKVIRQDGSVIDGLAEPDVVVAFISARYEAEVDRDLLCAA